jgi:DNA-binding GntR family transcriptional regulator
MLLSDTANQDVLLSSKAYSRLKEMILNNELRVGVHYLERELADILGVSRTPLKEALVRLEREGLIKVQPRHGMQVLPISADDMAEIYEVITALECEAIRSLALRGLNETEINALEETTQRMEAALAQDTLEDWAVADEAFHRLLLDLCHNKRLKQTVLMFWDQSHRARYLTLGFREKPTNSTEDHRQVVAAIKNRDAETAAAIHQKHRVKGGAKIVEILRKLPMGGS